MPGLDCPSISFTDETQPVAAQVAKVNDLVKQASN